jgi:hypothetical protein
MQPLRLPKTIRTPRFDEVPKNEETFERIRARESAKIVQGYTIKANENPGLFTFFSEVNVNVDQLWPLFIHLMLQLPEDIALVYGPKDEELNFSKYVDKFELLNILTPLEIELTHDGFLEFGVIYNDERMLEEVLVAPSKYIQYWGADVERFKQSMHEFSIYEVPDLQFIDEFPLVTESASIHFPGIQETGDVLEILDQAFFG